MTQSERAALDALIAEATVDCYNESECVTGFYTMLVDNLAVPFQIEVLGVEVTVTGVDLTEEGQITAVCMRVRPATDKNRDRRYDPRLSPPRCSIVGMESTQPRAVVVPLI